MPKLELNTLNSLNNKNTGLNTFGCVSGGSAIELETINNKQSTLINRHSTNELNVNCSDFSTHTEDNYEDPHKEL